MNFNKAIDPARLQVRLYETLQGKTYIDRDPSGSDFIDAAGYGNLMRTINLQAGSKNELTLMRLAELHPGVAFQLISSGQADTSFAGDGLKMDFSDATLLFNRGRRSGEIQYQFMPYDQLATQVLPGTAPQWMFVAQPRGITVEGKVGIRMTVPTLDGDYTYIPPTTRYLLIMGYNPERELIEPVGIGERVNNQVISVGKVELNSMDFIGYAWVHPQWQPRFKAVADGELSLQQLLGELQK